MWYRGYELDFLEDGSVAILDRRGDYVDRAGSEGEARRTIDFWNNAP